MSQIANQVIPEGYKETEVGVIPEDWECLNFGEIGDIVRGGSPRPAGDPKYFNGNFIPWLTVASLTNIKDSKQIVSSTKSMLTELGSFQSRILEKNTLIISNSGATLGVAKILGIRCCANDGVAALINQKKGHNSFLVHYLNTQTKRLHDDVATGNGQPNLNTGLIRLIPVPFPSEKEQTAIANALSDMDALLSELEKLIAKKQAIKTAAMQQLLTGKTRLPEFTTYTEDTPDGQKKGQLKGMKASELGEIPEDWEVKKIASVLSITTGNRNTQDKLSNGQYPFFVRSQTIERIDTYSFDGEAVLTAGDGVGTGKIFHYINGRFDYHQRVYLMYNFGKKIDGYYFYIYFSNFFYDKIMSMTAKSSVDSVRREMIADMLITLPSKKEQTAIAAILSDMDAEIQALEQRLQKTRQIKQGMMQELLTGKTRLPFDKAKEQGEAHAD